MFGSKKDGPGGMADKFNKMRKDAAAKVAAQIAETRDRAEAAVAAHSARQQASPKADPQAVYDQEVAANEPRSHNYTGSDSEALLALARKEFATYFSNLVILGGVVESADWHRNATRVWNASSNSYEQRDRSHVIAYIFADEGNGLASQWSVTITKDHMQSDRLSGHMDDKLRTTPLRAVKVFRKDKLG
jgi:hypothetical protein